MIDDFLDFLEFMDFIKSLDDSLTKVQSIDELEVNEYNFRELPLLSNLNLKYRGEPVNLYLINESDSFNPNLIYVSQNDYLSLQNLMHRKDNQGARLCEKACINDYPQLLTIGKKSCALFHCKDLTSLINQIKITNQPKKKIINKKSTYSKPEQVPYKSVKKQQLINDDSSMVTELIINDKRADDLMIGYLDNVIELLNNYCKPNDYGEIHLKSCGTNGHHSPSVILYSFYEVSKIAPIKIISKSRGEWIRELSFNIKEDKTVSELINYLNDYKKSINDKYLE